MLKVKEAVLPGLHSPSPQFSLSHGILFSEEVPESLKSFFWFCVICPRNWQISKKRNENLGLKFVASDRQRDVTKNKAIWECPIFLHVKTSCLEVSKRSHRGIPTCVSHQIAWRFCGTEWAVVVGFLPEILARTSVWKVSNCAIFKAFVICSNTSVHCFVVNVGLELLQLHLRDT